MEESLSKECTIKNSLFVIVLAFELVRNKIILPTKEKFYLSYFAFKNFKMIFLIKNFFCSSIENLQNMFYKRMLWIWFQNKSLTDGKQFYLLLISTLNSSKERTIPYRISLQECFCKEMVAKHLLCRSSQWARKTKAKVYQRMTTTKLFLQKIHFSP